MFSQNKLDKNMKEAGFSMATVFVGIALSSMVAVFINESLSSGFKGQKALELRMERAGILQYLNANLDCSKNITSSLCPSSGPVQLLRSDGSVLISKAGTGTKYGNWTLRADCLSSGDGYAIKAAMLLPGKTLASTQNDNFRKDPLTGKTVNWNSSDALLMPAGEGLCQASGGNGSTWEEILICTTVKWPHCSTPAQIAKYFTRPASVPTGYYSGSGKYTIKNGKTCIAAYTPMFALPAVPGDISNSPFDPPTFGRDPDGVSAYVEHQATASFKCR
ncbi:MAG: hypothetical protein NT027_03885 [Proteobacteria bacterium]|nr:hypothetical protein [Pseudomonadota bacterium]